jgi:serine protease Do
MKILLNIISSSLCISLVSFNVFAASPDYSSVVSNIMPSVVSINATKVYNKNDTDLQKAKQIEDLFNLLGIKNPDTELENQSDDKINSIGSGFFISEDGYLVTNTHVVEDAVKIEVILNDGRTYIANLVASDKPTDISVIKLSNVKYSEQGKFKSVKFANSDDVKVGNTTIVIGNPFGLGSSVTTGIVSARNRMLNSSPYNDYLQTDASINFGNSGGPLFNLDGEVIGINTAVYSNNNGANFGIGFAVPSNVVKDISERLIKDKKITRAWLGILVSEVNNKIAESTYYKGEGGAFVSKIIDKSPASLVDIKEMDIITEIGGKKITNFNNVPIVVSSLNIDEEIVVKLFRFGKEMEIKVILKALANESQAVEKKQKQYQTEEKQATVSGLNVSNSTDKNGVVVRSIDSSSEVFSSKLKKGMVITQIDSYPIKNIDNFVEVLTKLFSESRYTVLLKVTDGKADDIIPVSFR